MNFKDIGENQRQVTAFNKDEVNQLHPCLWLLTMTVKAASNLIKGLRLSKGMSQKELAIEAGISERTVQNIEAEKDVKLSVFFSVLKALEYQTLIKPIEENRK